MAQIPTVRVKLKESGNVQVINESDFNEEFHEKVLEREKRVVKKKITKKTPNGNGGNDA